MEIGARAALSVSAALDANFNALNMQMEAANIAMLGNVTANGMEVI
jgi:hypothetical protein